MDDVFPVEHQIVVRSLLGRAYGGATADRLAAATREMFFPTGTAIYEAGDPSKFVYFVVEGGYSSFGGVWCGVSQHS